MINKIIYCSIAGILLIIQGCSDKATNPQDNKNSQLFPMSIGNSWTYKTSNYDLSGNVTSTNNVTINIPRDTVISGETWYFYAFHGTIYWTTRSDGIWRWAFVSGENTIPLLYLKYPTSIGDTLTDTSSISSKTITSTISLDSLTATPLGNYHCILYLQSYFYNDTLQSVKYLFYSLGVGWVATDNYNVDSLGIHKTSRIELINCTIN